MALGKSNFWSRTQTIETFLLGGLAIHGIVILLPTHPLWWQWLGVLAVGLLALLNLGMPSWYTEKRTIVQSLLVLAVTWALLISTGGSASFFLFWLILSSAIYPLLLPQTFAVAFPILASMIYLYMLLADRTSGMPLQVGLSRTALILFVGEMAFWVGHQLQSYIAEHKKLGEHERAQRALANALSESAAALNQTLDLNEVLEQIVTNVGKVVPHDAANIALLIGDKIHFVRAFGYSKHGIDEKDITLDAPVSEVPPFRRMMETGQPVIIPDTATSPLWLADPKTAWIRSFAGAPIQVRGRIIGFLDLDSTTPGFFNEQCLPALQAFANQAATAIYNAQLYGESEERNRKLAILNEIIRAAATTLDMDELLQILADTAGQIIGGDGCYITRWDEVNQCTIPLAAYGELRDSYSRSRARPGEQTLTESVVTLGKPLAINDVFNTPYVSQRIASLFPTRSLLALPLLLDERPWGALIISFHEHHDFTEEEISWAQQAAELFSLALAKAHAYSELEHRVAERTAELQQTANQLEAILNSVGDGLVVLDKDGLVRIVNPAFEEQTGYSQAEVLGREYTMLLADSTFLENLRDQVHRLRQERSWRGETTIERKNGTTYEASISLTTLYDEQCDVVGYVCNLHDISAQKAVERMKDAFISNVSHELRTPIASLKLFHELLSANPDKQPIYMDRIRRETNRLEKIVEDLLYLSRLEQQASPLKPSIVELESLLRDYIDDRILLAQEKNLQLTFVPASQSLRVHADAGLLGQAFSILLTNALNYTPAGGAITVRTLTAPEDGSEKNQVGEIQSWVGFAVEDTGPGIQPEELAQLFDRFFRGKAGQDSGIEGIGLGLALVKEIVERHHGRVEVSSTGIPGEGATFTVWLPSAKETTGSHLDESIIDESIISASNK
jgi:two-component system phosphate regulon sensor histidine kinase PhoR